MKPSKLKFSVCCMLLLAILGVDPAQNLAKYKRWLICVHIQLTILEASRLCNSCIVSEHKTEKMCRVKDFPT